MSGVFIKGQTTNNTFLCLCKYFLFNYRRPSDVMDNNCNNQHSKSLYAWVTNELWDQWPFCINRQNAFGLELIAFCPDKSLIHWMLCCRVEAEPGTTFAFNKYVISAPLLLIMAEALSCVTGAACASCATAFLRLFSQRCIIAQSQLLLLILRVILRPQSRQQPANTSRQRKKGLTKSLRAVVISMATAVLVT